MRDYGRLRRLYERVYAHPRLVFTLEILGVLSVLITVLAFGLTVFDLLAHGDYPLAARLVLMAAIPFLAVTVMRAVVNAERPYETFRDGALSELCAGRRGGRSFPSRHALSAFVVGTLIIPYSLPLGAAVLSLGAVLCAVRVLLGIHFPRDVIAGAAIGVVAGVVGILIL